MKLLILLAALAIPATPTASETPTATEPVFYIHSPVFESIAESWGECVDQEIIIIHGPPSARCRYLSVDEPWPVQEPGVTCECHITGWWICYRLADHIR